MSYGCNDWLICREVDVPEGNRIVLADVRWKRKKLGGHEKSQICGGRKRDRTHSNPSEGHLVHNLFRLLHEYLVL